ncbi:P-loop containing nucleoside triphosphate hydrolase protein [Pseudomassariella vexata]|uniref:p-loop containing nucleoside triphosphate hydrolase protein n=1 Tax=Pseudomassariella vexata TaxID=1141098 RepID=A0A1Y2DXY8_9PEZI|nr:P-loop containing nucleoside triphosphate hydrolase protein [Pseudomassariella vexata]ORY64172.1 P-loop containing nucleoside triphosphate hydrolase protein [Pseudomassariella vexata]
MSVFARSTVSSLAIAVPICRCRAFSTSSVLQTAPRRTRDLSSSFSNTYDPDEEGRGPMFNKSTFGVPQFYPRDLKKRVDEYVVGQDRAKKTISSIIFNHYQGVRRRHHQEEQERKREEKMMRRNEARERLARERDPMHPVEGWHKDPPFHWFGTDEMSKDEFPGHNESVQHTHHSTWQFDEQEIEYYIPEDKNRPQHVKIDKSNLLLIGPTGVGKTYILETLSKKINVPFTICDCNSFTQAGYIGQDVETCIERLLIEANYDIKAAEHGIVVLDEFDKIAKRETMNGRDVGGEGVQQALLKLVEGTKVTVNVKDNRSAASSRSASPITTNYSGPGSSSSTSGPQSAPPPSGKVDQYTIDTTNILFVMCGAFVGLDKVILNRVSKPSMGFGSELRSRSSNSKTPDLPPELFKGLPHHPPNATNTSALTALDLATPEDLQGFGFIPELIGRVHNIVALTPLSQSDLLRILTEPRNSLVAQYTALFETYPSRLYFTQKSLRAITERAEKSQTGARGLKMEMERVLAEAMFDAPMSYVLVTDKAVRGQEKVGYWGKDGRMEVERMVNEEDGIIEHSGAGGREVISGAGFEAYREAGQSGA